MIKPKVWLSVVQNEPLDAVETAMETLSSSHDLVKCLAKGTKGSSTHDKAEFTLGYNRVAQAVFGPDDDDDDYNARHQRYREMLEESDKEDEEVDKALFKAFFIDLS